MRVSYSSLYQRKLNKKNPSEEQLSTYELDSPMFTVSENQKPNVPSVYEVDLTSFKMTSPRSKNPTNEENGVKNKANKIEKHILHGARSSLTCPSPKIATPISKVVRSPSKAHFFGPVMPTISEGDVTPTKRRLGIQAHPSNAQEQYTPRKIPVKSISQNESLIGCALDTEVISLKHSSDNIKHHESGSFSKKAYIKRILKMIRNSNYPQQELLEVFMNLIEAFKEEINVKDLVIENYKIKYNELENTLMRTKSKLANYESKLRNHEKSKRGPSSVRGILRSLKQPESDAYSSHRNSEINKQSIISDCLSLRRLSNSNCPVVAC